jgi:hypothetical protein
MGPRIKDEEEDLEKGNEAQTVRNASDTHTNGRRRGLDVLVQSGSGFCHHDWL